MRDYFTEEVARDRKGQIQPWNKVLGRAAMAGPIGARFRTSFEEVEDVPKELFQTGSAFLGYGPSIVAKNPLSFAMGGITGAGQMKGQAFEKYDRPIVDIEPKTPVGQLGATLGGLSAGAYDIAAASPLLGSKATLDKPKWSQKTTSEIQKGYYPWEKGWQNWYKQKWDEIYNRIPPSWRVVANKKVQTLVTPLDQTLQKEFVSLSPKASRTSKILAKVTAKGEKSLQIKELDELADSMWSSLSKTDIQKTASEPLKGALKRTASQIDNFVKERMPGLANIKAQYGEHRGVREVMQRGFQPWEVTKGRFGTAGGESTLRRMGNFFNIKSSDITKAEVDAFRTFEREAGVHFVSRAQLAHKLKRITEATAGTVGGIMIFRTLGRLMSRGRSG